MNYDQLIRDLRAEREKLDRIIASLEELQGNAGAFQSRKRRGRKFMGSVERQQVSERMKKYWAARKRAGAAKVT